jgi:hypothetical protein
VNAAAPCLFSGNLPYGPSHYGFFWKTPVEARCTKYTAFMIPTISFETLDFAYELRTPNPLNMSSGLYTGSMSYSIGPAGDFDFGSVLRPDDASLNLDFVLDVQHTLKIDLPPGANNVTLEPAGGWASWLDSGRKPTQVFRDQLFYISASSRFKVMMLCNSPGGNTCRLGSAEGNTTDIQDVVASRHQWSWQSRPDGHPSSFELQHVGRSVPARSVCRPQARHSAFRHDPIRHRFSAQTRRRRQAARQRDRYMGFGCMSTSDRAFSNPVELKQ